MTEAETKSFKERVENWLLKLPVGVWYTLPATDHPNLFITHVEYCIDCFNPYMLDKEKTKVCNISLHRDQHWNEFKKVKPYEWVEIKNRPDYEVLVHNLKWFIDVKMHGELDKDFTKFRWIDAPFVTIK